MRVSLRVKYTLFLPDLNEKYSNVQFHENPSSVSRVVRADGQTDTTKLIVKVKVKVK